MRHWMKSLLIGLIVLGSLSAFGSTKEQVTGTITIKKNSVINLGSKPIFKYKDKEIKSSPQWLDFLF